MGQKAMPAWGMTPGALFHELLGLGLNWEVAANRFEPASGTAFLKFRERPSFWGSVRYPQDDGRMFCHNHTERLNRGFSTVKRKACGYRAIVNRIITLHRVAGKLRLPHAWFHSNR